MTTSAVDICNAALGRLGQDVRIGALTDATKPARACNSVYQRVLEYVLADVVWPFTVKCIALALQGDGVNGWLYRYAYPADCMTALAVTDGNGTRQYRDMGTTALVSTPIGVEYEVAYIDGDDRSILTDQEAAWLVYSSTADETIRYPPHFIEALVCRLALELAPMIAGDIGIRMAQSLEQKYIAARDRAQVHGLNESAENMLGMVTPTMAARGV